MRKLLIALAVAACATCVQAAAYTWTTGAALKDYYGATLTKDVTLEVFCSTLDGLSMGTWVVSNGTQTQKQDIPGTGVEASFTDGTVYKFFFEYTVDGYTFTSKEFGSKKQATSVPNLQFTMANGTWTAAVPEPTSGLLMLLGMAGLALRRRRA